MTGTQVQTLDVEIFSRADIDESETDERPRNDDLGFKRCSRPELWDFLYPAQVVLNAHLVGKVKAPRCG